jgi:homocysteine S-methyltransferase
MNRSSSSRRQRQADLREMLAVRILVCDGAMGTMLQAAGVPLDLSLPELNVSRPDLVGAVHGAYIAAGADIIETNTFGAGRTRLLRYGLEDRVAEFNRAAVQVAKAAVSASGRQVLIAGSVSPATPPSSRGRIAAAALRDAFREQVQALAESGVDFVIFETFGSLDELVEAISAAKEVDSALPLVAQMTFLDDGKTLAGESPAEVARGLEGRDLAAMGANCTLGPQGLLDILGELAKHTSLPLAAQPNAGSPSFVDGRFQYTADPAYFARYSARYAELGGALIGGCCGTTPAHVEAVASAVKGLRPVQPQATRQSTASSATVADFGAPEASSSLLERLQAGTFVTIAEMSPPAAGAAEQAVRSATQLHAAGCDAVLISPPNSPRAQLSPTSIAVLTQQRVEGIEAVLTVATWEKSVMGLQADLLGAYAFGIRNVVCRTGTPPLVGDYPNTGGFWDVDSVELIQLLKSLNEGKDRHGIPLAQPTAFTVGARINPAATDSEREVLDARRKLDAGADFFITPPVFDVAALDRLLDAVGVPENFPVLMGVMPLRDYRHAEFLHHEVPGMSLPPSVLERMLAAGEDAPEMGQEIARELIATLRGDTRIKGVTPERNADGNGRQVAFDTHPPHRLERGRRRRARRHERLPRLDHLPPARERQPAASRRDLRPPRRPCAAGRRCRVDHRGALGADPAPRPAARRLTAAGVARPASRRQPDDRRRPRLEPDGGVRRPRAADDGG